MAGSPLGPWRLLADGPDARADQGRKTGTWLDEFTSLYRALAKLGIGAAEADGTPLWIIAAQIGALEPEHQSTESAAEFELSLGREMQRRRIQAAEDGTDPPTWRELESEMGATRADVVQRVNRNRVMASGWVGPRSLPDA